MLSNLLRSRWAVFCLLALVVLAVFGRTIWFDYVHLDEGVLIENNKFFISDLSNFFEVFKHDINYPSAVAPYYRPIFVLSFMFNSQVGTSPLAYHVGNVLLHILAVFLVFVLLRELNVKTSASLFFSGLFAVHPAVTPVVAWAPGRIEAILAIFTILSFISFARFLKTSDWRYLAGFFASFAIALFTKEVVIALLPVLFFYYLMHPVRSLARDKVASPSDLGEATSYGMTLFSGLVAIIIGWFFVRNSVLADARVAELSFYQVLSVLWSNISGIILYLGKAILPFNLTVLPVLESSTLIYGWIALAVILGLVLTKGHRKTFWSCDDQILGLVWFLVFLIPSLVSYNSPENMVFFEHRLYLPLIGIIIFFATSLSHRMNFGHSMTKYWSAAAVVILFSILAFNYSNAYANKTVFWQKAVTDSPKSSDAHNGLATSYLIDGKFEEAMVEFAKTLEINPKEKRVHLLLGLYYFDQSQYDKAKEEFEREIEIDQKQFVAYHGLGRIYIQRKNFKEAEKYLLKTVEINPDYILAQQDLAVLYFSQNKHPQAIVHLKELLKRQTLESLHPQIRKILEIYAKEAVLK